MSNGLSSERRPLAMYCCLVLIAAVFLVLLGSYAVQYLVPEPGRLKAAETIRRR